MQKENIVKRQNELFIFFILLLITPAIRGQLSYKDIVYSKRDSITGDINGDNQEDAIVVYQENAGNNLKVEMFLLDSIEGYTKRTREWFDVGNYTELKAEQGFLIYTVNYGRRESNYSTALYKYVEHFDDWFLFGFLENEMNDRIEPHDWEVPRLQGADIASTQVFGVEEICDSSSNLLFNQNSINNLFTNDYSIYLDEYRTKNYLQSPKHNMFKTLNYLNYIEISNGTVQKYNDIGFFLLEAGECLQAIYILENVVYKFPDRAVAYLNLGDAYYCNDEKSNAKEIYQKYIDLMRSSGKETKIPKRVWERVK